MISFCIKSNNLKITNYLIKKVSLTNLENIIYSKKNFSKYDNVIIHYKGKCTSEFYDILSNILCDCIIKFFEPQIVKNILFSNYFYFSSSELNNIEKLCAEALSNKDYSNHFIKDKDSNSFSDRKFILWNNILKYVTNNKSMILTGFVNFRIGSYIEFIENIVDNSVSQFVVDKEYLDFIELLKMYINSSPTTTDLIHLIYKDNNSILLDVNKQVILSNELNTLNYLSDISFSSNDYTLNTLLTLHPKNLIIHLNSPKDEFIQTLELIFEDKVQIFSDNDEIVNKER